MLEVLVLVILLTVWFFLPVFEFMKLFIAPVDDEMPIDNAHEQVDETPSVYIDKDLLPSKRKDYFNCYNQQGFQIGYSINGVPFDEKFEVERIRHFEVYNNIKMDDCNLSLNDDTYLQLYTQDAPNGIIVNANVYLTHAQWNTLVLVSQSSFSCTVCDVYCDETNHIQLDSHKDNLEKYKPLEKYDLSITRKIDNYYHCAVCNMAFHEIDTDDHFSSKEHEGRMLFAINKASDIMYDLSVHTENNNIELKKDTYHYNVRTMNNLDDLSSETDEEYTDYDKLYDVKCSDDEDDENFYDNVDPPLNLEHSYASMARKPKTDEPDVLDIDLGNKKVTVKFDSWNMVISPKANRFYCMVCTQFDHIRRKAEHCRSEDHITRLEQCKVVDMYEKYLVRQVDDKLYHCGHCNNLQLINEMEDHIESQHPSKTTNLDSPAKTRPSTPLKKLANGAAAKNITETLKNNIDQITNKSVQINNNINGQANHRNDQANYRNDQANLRNDKANYRNDQANYRNDQANYRNDQANYRNDQAIHRNDQAKHTIQAKNANMGNLNMYHDLRAVNNNLEDDMIICVYGYKLRISKLAYNIVCGRDSEFYCGLCEIIINKNDLKIHVNDMQHIILLQRTPFIEAFNIHFYRQIREALHCALCNELIPIIPEMIFRHRAEPKHLVSLGRALRSSNENIHPAVARTVEKQAATLNTANTARTACNVQSTNNVNKLDNSINKEVKQQKNIIPNIEDIAPVKNPVDVKTAPRKLEETEEYIDVKNGVKDAIEDSTDDELNDSIDTPFDFEEYLYIKLGNSYIKITNTSYNTLVEIGDGTRYCFVCSIVVSGDLKKHVESRAHMENMEKYKFVDKYKEDLLRQIYLMYHCSICNVLITRKQVNHHLSWPTHTMQTENTKITSKQRKNEIKSGTKQITANTQKENIYLNENETKIKIVLNVSIQKDNVVSVERKNKIIIFNDNVLKISFDSWHSVTALANGWKCKVCQTEFDGKEFATHVSSEWHKGYLDKFDKQYSPALIRKINDSTLNCIMCNTEVSNKHHIVLEHVQGKKHMKNYENILKESSVANSYADCDEDVLML